MSAEMEIVSTPTMAWLKRNLGKCRRRFWAASPFVGEVLFDLTRDLGAGVEKRLVTRPDIRYFASNMSSLEAIRGLASYGVRVESLGRLHAKVYIVDEAVALVTSANSTYAGLNTNAEVGIAVNKPETVNDLAKLYATGFGMGKEELRPVSVEDLDELDNLVEKVRPVISEKPVVKEDGAVPDEPPLVEVDGGALLDSFHGWRRLAPESIVNLGRGDFALDDLQPVCKSLVSKQGLTYRRPTLRRVLQELRDRGLVEFVDYEGNYRRTFVLGDE